MIKKLIELQHYYFALPFSIFKIIPKFQIKFLRYFTHKYCEICVWKDLNTFGDNRDYWFTKRSLYWHYFNQEYSRVRDSNKLIEVEKVFPKIFKKKVINIGCGLATMHKKFFIEDLTLMDANKFVVKELKKKFFNTKIICSNIKKIKGLQYDTVIFNQVLMYLTEAEIEIFFRNNYFKNIVILGEGADKTKKLKTLDGYHHNLNIILKSQKKFK